MILLDSDISVSDKCMKNYLENNESKYGQILKISIA